MDKDSHSRHNARIELRSGHLALLSAAAVTVFTLIFSVWTATSRWSFPLFLLAVLGLVYFPGRMLLDIQGLRLRFLDGLSLSLVLGMTVSSILFWLLSYAGVPSLFYVWPLAATLTCLYRRRLAWKKMLQIRLHPNVIHFLLSILLLLSIAPLAILPNYYQNLARLPNKGMTFQYSIKDANFHLSIANELAHSIPPQVPFIAGHPLNYHYASDLFVTLFSKTAGLSIADLTVRYVPTFFIVMTVLAIFTFSRLLLRSAPAALLATFLVIFGEDFSFIPGLLTGSASDWSASFFQMPTVFSLYYHNPMLPALGILFSGLFCMINFFAERKNIWLLLSAFLFAILTEYKVFAAAQILTALAIAAVVYLLFYKDTGFLKIVAMTVCLAVPLLLYMWHLSSAGGKMWLRMDPGSYLMRALINTDLIRTSVGDHASRLLKGGIADIKGWLSVFLVILPGYLVGSLGMRVIGLPAVVKKLFKPGGGDPMRFLLAIFCVLGPIITLVGKLTPYDYPGDYNNIVWFYVQSKYVIWIFVAEAVRSIMAGTGRRFWQVAVLLSILAFSLPSTLQSFAKKMAWHLDVLSSKQMALLDFLKKEASPGEVVISNESIAMPIVSLTTCRVPALGIFANSLVSKKELTERLKDVNDFWNAWKRGELRVVLLRKYRVSYIVCDRMTGDAVPPPKVLVDATGRPRPGVILKKRFKNNWFTVYRVTGAATAIFPYFPKPH